MRPSPPVGAATLFFFLGHPPSWIISAYLALWMVSPAIAWWISLPLIEKRVEFSTEQIFQLRKLARRTWNFFETFVNADHHWLPPDNFQEYPQPVIATRTSTTNLGLAVLSALAAHDFGYISLPGLTESLDRTLETMEKLERYRGHFYNWYETRTLKPMMPLYISTVDNGNLAGLLLTLHSGLLELAEQNWSPTRIVAGLHDTLDVLKEAAHSPAATTNFEPLEKLLAENSRRGDRETPAEIIRLLDEAIAVATKLSGVKNQADNEFESWPEYFRTRLPRAA